MSISNVQTSNPEEGCNASRTQSWDIHPIKNCSQCVDNNQIRIGTHQELYVISWAPERDALNALAQKLINNINQTAGSPNPYPITFSKVSQTPLASCHKPFDRTSFYINIPTEIAPPQRAETMEKLHDFINRVLFPKMLEMTMPKPIRICRSWDTRSKKNIETVENICKKSVEILNENFEITKDYPLSFESKKEESGLQCTIVVSRAAIPSDKLTELVEVIKTTGHVMEEIIQKELLKRGERWRMSNLRESPYNWFSSGLYNHDYNPIATLVNTGGDNLRQKIKEAIRAIA